MNDNRTKLPIGQDLVKLNVEFVASFREELQRSEIRILRAMETYFGSLQKHFTDLERSHSAIQKRLGACEPRLHEVEKRLNIPPAA